MGKLDFVAPSNGGWSDIATLDPVGAIGWTPEDYKMMFGGTSSATPLAAGIAALMLSVNPTLTENEIRTILRNTCDKIGGVTYVNGTHPEYGHGRVNAAKAVESAMPAVSVNDVTTTEGSGGTPGTATFPITISAATVRDVTVDWNTANGTALAGTNFTAANGTLTIPSGAVSTQVSVNLIGGVLAQPSVNFFLHLGTAANAAIFRPNGKGTITALDTDHDGMPDYWEIANTFDKADPADATLDADGDGLTNVQEFLGNTNPHDAADPALILGTRMSGADFFFTFKSVADRTYRIETKDQLTDSSWQPLGADLSGVSARSAPCSSSARVITVMKRGSFPICRWKPAQSNRPRSAAMKIEESTTTPIAVLSEAGSSPAARPPHPPQTLPPRLPAGAPSPTTSARHQPP